MPGHHLGVVQAWHSYDPFTLQSAKVVVHANASFKQLWARLIANPSPSIALLLDRLHVPLRRSPLAYSSTSGIACRTQGSILMYLDMQSNIISSARLVRAWDGGNANSSARTSIHNQRPGQDQCLLESPSIVAHLRRDGMALHRTCSQLCASISTFLQPKEKAVSADKLCAQARH
jgi:hypothetical protein